MSEVFELSVKPSQKLVLLAMADHARDDGTGCYPSVATLARKTSHTRRGVQKVMRTLELLGLIVPSKISRGRTTTEYTITLSAREQGLLPLGATRGSVTANREPGSPLNTQWNGERDSPQPRMRFADTANGETSNREPGSPEPLRTISEPSLKQNRSAVPDWIPPDKWKRFLEMRRAIRKPVLAYACELLIQRLELLKAEGSDPGEVLEQSIRKSQPDLYSTTTGLLYVKPGPHRNAEDLEGLPTREPSIFCECGAPFFTKRALDEHKYYDYCPLKAAAAQ